MPVLNQKGLIQYIVLLVLAAGLVGGLYLVQHPTILRPHAEELSNNINVNVGSSAPTVCSPRLASFSASNPCNEIPDGFRNIQYTCASNPGTFSDGNSSACKTINDWLVTAQGTCQAQCSVNGPTAVPTPANGGYSLKAFPAASIQLSINDALGTPVWAILRDQNGSVVTDYSDIDYIWTSPNNDMVETDGFAGGCTDGIQPPCPYNHVKLIGKRVGSTTVRAVAFKKSNGLGLAGLDFSVTVYQPNSGPTPTPPPYPTAKPIPTAPPVNISWTFCAQEFQTCNYSGTANVRYGTNDSNYVYRTLNGPVDCGNGTFGDPAFGFLKHCDYQLVGGGQYAPTPTPQPSSGSNGNWVYCSQEFSGPCTFQGTKQVRYGANDTFTDQRTFTSSVDCGNSTFGDPLPGVLKHCEYLNR